MERRQFLQYAGSSIAAIALVQCTRAAKHQRPSPPLVSVDGALTVDLTATEQTVTLAGRSAQLLTYNGQMPGPLWEVQAGDTLAVNFTNGLTQPTNLHFHGLHIPPTDRADNVFVSVPSGEQFRYEFAIAPTHPGGLFWYHPHHHGLVAAQLAGGLAGPLIVRGAVDAIPEIQAASEEILVLQDFDLTWRGQRREPTPIFRRWGRQGDLITVNGDRAPGLTIPQRGLLRLRLLNASPSRIYRLRLENHPWHLIGMDGSTLAAPLALDDLILAPGNRADVLVAGDREPGAYTLMSLPYDRGISDMMAAMEDDAAPSVDAATGAIAQLQYGDATTEVPLPQTLLTSPELPTPSRRREFVLDHGIDGDQAFLINGRGFAHDRVDTTVQLGTVEEWHIVNKAGMDHPFHLHTNAFQIVRRNGQPVPTPMWQDVVNIPAYESVDLLVPFNDFAGKTVYHCHILDHEDQGMMGIIEMQAASTHRATQQSMI
ncbi:multicopper oxidase family protein [Leptolyngbya iicbica]|uniref:Multicopper oxidase family protein n=2 Tax=Cyanophyceae TaxID=3028117 RepID=A0A4Q7E3G1_9CYAN|nr:multicopper oxidase family protein [Leptolyngbya sp. LK]RZM77206.1 multicopper oxidase family protein [Leptolyngbya sp. LK]